MKNEQSIRHILEAIEKAVDKQPKVNERTRLKESVQHAFNQFVKSTRAAQAALAAQGVTIDFSDKINEAKEKANAILREAKLDKQSFKQVSKGEGKGGAKQDNEIKGKKPSEKKVGEDAEDWKEVDAKTETNFGSKPTEKKPQDASKDDFKKVGTGANKAKKIDTDPTFSKVNGKVKGGAKSNVADVKKK